MNLQLRAFFLIIVFFACSIFAQPGAGEEEQEIIANGLGAIINGDEAKAADDALASALRSAVEQVVGTMIESEVLVRNYMVVEDKIYSQTKGYVKTYDVLRKIKKGNVLEMTIRAVVKKGNIHSDLDAIGLLMSRKNKPRIMVLVDEKNMGHRYYHWATVDLNTTETELTNKLMEKGFTFVERNIVAKKLNRDAVLAAFQGDYEQAKAIAAEAGAEVLIVGVAVSKPASAAPSVLRSAGMVSCQAMVNIKAVRADDGRVIAASSQQSAAAHIDQMAGGTQALQKASGEAAVELANKILSTWKQDVYSGTTIQMRVLEVPTFNDLVAFKNLLKINVRGVQDIHQRDFSGSSAVLDIEIKGDAGQIAEELVFKDFSPYQIDVISAAQNTIVVKMSYKF